MKSKFQRFVQNGLVLTAGLCLVAVPVAPEAKAALSMNGFTINGITLNGMRVNGIRFNDINLKNTQLPTTNLNTIPAQNLRLEGGQLVLHLNHTQP